MRGMRGVAVYPMEDVAWKLELAPYARSLSFGLREVISANAKALFASCSYLRAARPVLP